VRLLFEEPGDVEEGSPLFDVPWEFVSFRVEDEPRQVATNPGMRFARVASRHDDNEVDLEPGRAPAGVLGIAIQLEEWQAKMPFFTQRLTQKSKDVVWPKHGALAGSLEAAITQNPGVFDALVLDTPSPFRVRTTIQNWEETKQGLSEMEVVHYCGFGEMQDGSPKIALADDEGEEEWRDLEDLYSRVAQSGARVLVVQFLLPMLGTDPVPIPASAFVSALRGEVNAVVFTPVPIHPRQASSFNQTFYDELGRGATVEAAVQTARARVAEDRFLNDSASFGWFTLLTGPRSGLRLVDPAAGSAGKFRDATSASEREH
jgi:hypothetical protein